MFSDEKGIRKRKYLQTHTTKEAETMTIMILFQTSSCRRPKHYRLQQVCISII